MCIMYVCIYTYVKYIHIAGDEFLGHRNFKFIFNYRVWKYSFQNGLMCQPSYPQHMRISIHLHPLQHLALLTSQILPFQQCKIIFLFLICISWISTVFQNCFIYLVFWWFLLSTSLSIFLLGLLSFCYCWSFLEGFGVFYILIHSQI